jgi:SAM-dependent methyltransferase
MARETLRQRVGAFGTGVMAAAALWVLKALGPDRARTLLQALLQRDAGFVQQVFDLYLRAAPHALLSDAAFIAHLRRECDRQNSPFYAFHVFAEMSRCAVEQGFRPGKVLEIGTGATLGNLFCFAASGVERATGVDIEPIANCPPAFYRELKDYLACVGGFAWWRNYAALDARPEMSYPHCWEKMDAEALYKRIEYCSPVRSDRLPFQDDTFDFCYSVAVFEHLDQPDGTLANLHRVLTPNGLMVHEIDLRDHGSTDPLRFLGLSENEYLQSTQKYGGGKGIEGILDGSWTGEPFCNRLRLSDWQDAFARAGFQTLKIEPLCVCSPGELERHTFADPFRGKPPDDLAVLQFRIVARCVKP